MGGVARGRRVGDVCVFDTVKMEWIEVSTKMKPGEVEIAHLTSWPARSGHAACAWGSKVLVIGGHGVDDPVDAKCEVWVLETTTRVSSFFLFVSMGDRLTYTCLNSYRSGVGSSWTVTRRAPVVGTPRHSWMVRGPDERTGGWLCLAARTDAGGF